MEACVNQGQHAADAGEQKFVVSSGKYESSRW